MEPMSQEFVTEIDHNEVKLNEEIDYLLDGIDFQQSLSQENGLNPVEHESVNRNEEIDNLLDGIDFQESLTQEKLPTSIPSSFPEENGFNSVQDENTNRDEEMSSPLLFIEEENSEEKTVTVPVIEPFTCSEEKSPVHYEDTLDTLEELPFVDIGDTYLTDDQFNQKYPQHPIDVSFSVNNSCNTSSQ